MVLAQQTATAALLVVISVAVQCGSVAALITWIRSLTPKEIHQLRILHSAALVTRTTIAVILLHGIVILLWASCYRWLCLPSWESAFYFSSGSYSTVGSDVVLPEKWRLLGPLESMVGMLMAGMSVALLFAAVTHLVDADPRRHLVHSYPENIDRIAPR
jgi:voltage-gated potassium channel